VRPRLPSVTALVVCLATATSARAADPEGPRADVAVVRPVSDDPVLVAASARIRLELGAGGSTSALVDVGDGFPARVALVREDGVPTIDVLGTPAAGAVLHRRVRVPRAEGGDDPAVLAVRAVELLRGIRLEVRRIPVVAPAPAATADADGDAPKEPERATWRFEAGLGVLTARPFGAALAAGPALAAAGVIAPHVSFTATFAGPFFTDRPGTPDGSAHTGEELGALGLRADTWRSRLNLHALATVGLHHVSAAYDARGMSPTSVPPLHVVTPQSLWNPAITLAVGASLRLSDRVGVSLQLAAIFVDSALSLVSNGRDVGTLGAPSLLPTLSAWTAL
jgi:hypothetical protein